VIVEHLRDDQLDYELGKCDELREPPVPATACFLDEWHAVELYGWSGQPQRL
jgi:hypothetical protein